MLIHDILHLRLPVSCAVGGWPIIEAIGGTGLAAGVLTALALNILHARLLVS